MITQKTKPVIETTLFKINGKEVAGETFPVTCGHCQSINTNYVDGQEEREGYTEYFECLDCKAIIEIHFD